MSKFLLQLPLCSILLITSLLRPTLITAQTSTEKEIELKQKECYDGLSEDERMVYFPTKEQRKVLLTQVIDKFSRERQYMSEEEKRKLFESIEKMAPSSPYQDLNSYWIIKNVLKDALPIFRRFNICSPSFDPKFATLLCPSVNADARKVNDEFVLFVNAKLINFCYQMVKSMVEAIGISKESDTLISISLSKADMIRKIKKDANLQQRFIAQLRHAYYGKKYKDYIQPEVYDPLVGELTHYMELFIINHELFHASQKHDLESVFVFSENETYNAADSLLKRKQTAIGWSYELLADYYGQLLLNQYASTVKRTYFSDMAKLGGLLYLTFDHVYQKALYVFEHGERPKTYNTRDIDQIGTIVNSFTKENPSDSLLHSIDWTWTQQDHPPYELRSEIISNIIEKNLSSGVSKAEKSATYGFFILGKHLLSAIETLYNTCEPDLIKIAKQQNLQQ